MHLNLSDQVAGLPATHARQLLRRFDDPQPEVMIGSWIDTGSRTGAEVARAFEDAGYLQFHMVDRDGETWWESTTSGSALAHASFNPPITRKTAERLLAGVIERAKRFNADESHLTDIAELVMSWPEKEPLTILANRSAFINLTDKDVRTLTDRWEAVYRYIAL